MGGNLKLILGLIWTLILHYQISIGFGLEDQSKDGPSPKQALLNWLNVCEADYIAKLIYRRNEINLIIIRTSGPTVDN